MVPKILCVAEKPSIAKAVANHLGATVQVRNVPGVGWIKNYEFEFTFNPPWGRCPVVMTSVAGHINKMDFDSRYRSWTASNPSELFEATIIKSVEEDKKPIAKNIETQARYSKALYIWTDCDREGEHIGSEIRDIALKINGRLEVKRAKFSNIERAHIIQAAKAPIDLDEKQANAVEARIELDLRIGASFTRMQTNRLLDSIRHLSDLKMISYGSCQFPTLGFVVDRYFKVKNFVPETFWKIQVMHEREDKRVTFHWKRSRLFDRMIVTLIFERCIAARTVKVTNIQTKPTSKWRPLPLTTVELQKASSRFLRMDSQRAMKVAEDLYTKGFISYPRTETDQFDNDMDLRRFVGNQVEDTRWGGYAQGLLDGSFRQPRNGRSNDQAHPPIHPVNYVTPPQLNDEERRVYEFVVRRFLACCSEDAKGQTSTVELTYGGEIFTATGLVVLERNYLDVYPYDKWESSQQLPKFTLNETFVPTEAKMTDGETTPPGYLTEPELIALMDSNGIGTDATMAEHIAKIKDRNYVMTQPRGGGRAAANGGGSDEENAPAAARGGRGRGRGRGGRGRGGRGGAGAGAGGARTDGVQEFIPTTLGVALIEGYDKVGFDLSLGKPFLRKEMEQQMKAICDGTASRTGVVQESVDKYREVFVRTVQQIDVLKAMRAARAEAKSQQSLRKYVLGEEVAL